MSRSRSRDDLEAEDWMPSRSRSREDYDTEGSHRQGVRSRDEEEEEFEVLDVTNSAGINERRITELWNKLMGDLSKQSAAKQVCFGSVCGAISGWLFVKVGKTAAATLGTTILVIQIAQHQGYIQINWDRVRSEMEVARTEARRVARTRFPGFANNFRDFVRKNVFLAAGFGGGFLIGMVM